MYESPRHEVPIKGGFTNCLGSSYMQTYTYFILFFLQVWGALQSSYIDRVRGGFARPLYRGDSYKYPYTYYLLGICENYGLTAEHIHKIVQSSVYSWTMYINGIRRLNLVIFLLHRVVYLLFLNFNHTVQFTILCHSWEIQEFSHLCFTSFDKIIGEIWLVVFGLLLGTFVVFCHPCLHLSDEHGTWSTFCFKWNVFVILYLLCPARASYVYKQCGLIPSAVWRFFNNISSTFKWRMVALNRDIVFKFRYGHRCIWAYWVGMVCLSVHSYVCLSIVIFVFLPLNLYIFQYILASVGTFICPLVW